MNYIHKFENTGPRFQENILDFKFHNHVKVVHSCADFGMELISECLIQMYQCLIQTDSTGVTVQNLDSTHVHLNDLGLEIVPEQVRPHTTKPGGKPKEFQTADCQEILRKRRKKRGKKLRHGFS